MKGRLWKIETFRLRDRLFAWPPRSCLLRREKRSRRGWPHKRSLRGDVRRSSNMLRRVPLRKTTLRLTMKENPSLLVTRIQSSWLGWFGVDDDDIEITKRRVSDVSNAISSMIGDRKQPGIYQSPFGCPVNPVNLCSSSLDSCYVSSEGASWTHLSIHPHV